MIDRLQIHHLRVLTHVSLTLSQCNLFVGENGSGKTSLLEAVFVLSRGKSFRHHQPRLYIQHEAEQATLFASLTDGTTLAVEKLRRGQSRLRYCQQPVATQSELTRHLPVLRLDPTILDLFDHGSSSRRQLLDWLVFHVCPAFHKQWLTYQRLLKQRNRLLKTRQVLSASQRIELAAWDHQLADSATQITRLRQSVFNQWFVLVIDRLRQFLPQYADDITLRFKAGYDEHVSLSILLRDRMDKDMVQGFTRIGPHRADMQIVLGQLPAADVLSRGEKKLMLLALKLAQIELLHRENIASVVLLDDVNAELDEAAIQRLLQGLQACQSQLFVTSLSMQTAHQMKELWQDNLSVFHVKQGSITPTIF